VLQFAGMAGSKSRAAEIASRSHLDRAQTGFSAGFPVRSTRTVCGRTLRNY
jgi:hypothetical protein